MIGLCLIMTALDWQMMAWTINTLTDRSRPWVIQTSHDWWLPWHISMINGYSSLMLSSLYATYYLSMKKNTLNTSKNIKIADAANLKRHQWLDEILIIFTRTIQKISKVVCKKTMSETRAFITSLCCMKRVHYSKHMLRKQDCVKFSTLLISPM